MLCPSERLRWFVLCIVGGIYEQNSIVKNVHVDNWTAELAIIATNTYQNNHCNQTVGNNQTQHSREC